MLNGKMWKIKRVQINVARWSDKRRQKFVLLIIIFIYILDIKCNFLVFAYLLQKIKSIFSKNRDVNYQY